MTRPPLALAGAQPEHAHTLFLVETAALWGGPQKRLFRLARGWAARGHSTVVAALRGDEHSPREQLEHLGLPVLALTGDGKEVLKSFHPTAARAVRALVARLGPRVVFTMETLVDYHARLGLLGRDPLVVTLLGIDRWNWEARFHRRLVMRWLAQRPGAVIANSERVLAGWRRVLGERRFARRPAAVIPNPVDPQEFEARFERAAGGDLVVGGLGRFAPQKGFDLLLEAFARLPERQDGRLLRLELQGRGPDEPALRARATQLGLGDRFRIRPFDTDVQPFLHGLDLLVVPSRWSGFENVVLEGVLCGTPTLCSSGAGLDALFDLPGFRPFDPEPAALVAALEGLLAAPPAERVELARAQHVALLRELDLGRIAERIEDFLSRSALLIPASR